MKNILLLGLVGLILSACGGNTEQTASTSEIEKPPSTELQAEPSTKVEAEKRTAISGLYTLSSHDQSWAVVVEKINGKWAAKGVESDAMLPPIAEIFNYPEELAFIPFKTFTVNEDNNSFSSDWGKGKFEMENSFMMLVFEEKEGLFHPETAHTDTALSLSKQDNVH